MSKVQEVDPLDGPLQSCACQGVSIEVLLYYSRVFRKNSQATHLPWKNSQATHLPWFPLWKPLPSTCGCSRCLFCLSDQNILQPSPSPYPFSLMPSSLLVQKPSSGLRARPRARRGRGLFHRESHDGIVAARNLGAQEARRAAAHAPPRSGWMGCISSPFVGGYPGGWFCNGVYWS